MASSNFIQSLLVFLLILGAKLEWNIPHGSQIIDHASFYSDVITLTKCNSFEFFIETKIPKMIYQVYHNKSRIPTKVWQNIKEKAHNWGHRVFDINEVKDYMDETKDENLINTFNALEMIAHKVLRSKFFKRD